MESEDSPALREKGVKVRHVKQRKAGRILFKKPKSRVPTRRTYSDENCLRASIS
jgi:hypothetical protein